MDVITQFVVHHSGASRSQSPESIREYHMAAKPDGRGFNDVAYHYLIDGYGRLHIGRPLPTTGAHAPPNAERIGVCVIGDNTKDRHRWTNKQKRALYNLWHAVQHLWPGIELVGHRDVMPGHTKCPAIDVRKLLLEG